MIKESQKRRAAALKAQGRCVSHKDRFVAVGSSVHCQECLNRSDERRRKAQASGKCRNHSKREATDGTLCAECRTKMRRLRDQNLSRGLCPCHPDTPLVSGRKRCQKCLDALREKKYDVTAASYENMLQTQSFACALCRQTETATRDGIVKALAVDHDHKTGHVRGLLCMACNTTWVRAMDSISHLTETDREQFFGRLSLYMNGLLFCRVPFTTTFVRSLR